MYGLFALFGWCGTPYPGWWRHPPHPDPEPWWFIVKIISAVGGVAGGLAVQRIVGGDASFVTIASFAGAFAGGRLLGDLGSAVLGKSRA